MLIISIRQWFEEKNRKGREKNERHYDESFLFVWLSFETENRKISVKKQCPRVSRSAALLKRWTHLCSSRRRYTHLALLWDSEAVGQRCLRNRLESDGQTHERSGGTEEDFRRISKSNRRTGEFRPFQWVIELSSERVENVSWNRLSTRIRRTSERHSIAERVTGGQWSRYLFGFRIYG